MRLAAIACLMLLVSGCSDSYESQTWRLATVMKYNKIGSSRDYWLVKYNFFGDWEKVSLIFGFMDDRAFCEEIAALYVKKYPSDKYMCMAANY